MFDVAEFQEFAVTCLLMEGTPPRHLVHRAMRRHPDAPAGDVLFELICIANDLESRYTNRDDTTLRLAGALFKACALLAADMQAIGEDRLTGVRGRDLLHFWGEADGYFALPRG